MDRNAGTGHCDSPVQGMHIASNRHLATDLRPPPSGWPALRRLARPRATRPRRTRNKGGANKGGANKGGANPKNVSDTTDQAPALVATTSDVSRTM